MKRKLSQKPVNIDAGLFDELEEYLKSKNAKTRGHHSKAQFVTEVVGSRLEKESESIDRVMFNNLYRIFSKKLNKYELLDYRLEIYEEFMELIFKITDFDKLLAKKAETYPPGEKYIDVIESLKKKAKEAKKQPTKKSKKSDYMY